ncbi:ABC transporter substrate-binding protein [Paenibacillus sp. NEAU-GSW1]|uniref:ABC transporter substrate-binding protein n=1 Tax=Paenibacillus sp. NEAU-GSW1 TaxID=2682486 RepID=UPI0012E14CBA|nr:ABC transporter substrate-binding protein [Paenibacillus sp. NEAU-GSW1]MUT67533.1 ABC transporter substrate-binding protein [Paenibacillus sp. NEAU-GSW1]
MTRIQKRSWFSYSAIVLAIAVALTGCSSSKGSSGGAESGSKAAETTAAPVQGGELTYALATSPISLDPHTNGLAVGVRVINNVFDSLVVQLPDGSVKPWLAKSWTVSEDGLTYTFKLRDDVKFHDGTPFNAEAVKFNFDRVIDPATKASNALALIQPYKSSKVIDDYTVEVQLGSPSQAFLRNLGQGTLGIVSPTAAKKYGEQFSKNPVGSGPFKFVKWEENAQIVIERNPDYKWANETAVNQGAPYLDTISFKIVPEEATRIGSVKSGQVLAGETVPPQNIVSIKQDSKFQLLSTNTGGLPYTLFINQRKAPWNELKVRQALQSAIDVGSIVKSLYLGTYEQAWSPLAPSTLGYDKSLEGGVKPDLDQANKWLDEAGWARGADGIREKNGKKLTLHYLDGSPNREKRNDIAAIVQQQLKEIGIDVQVDITKDIATKVFVNDDYDIYGNSQVNSDPNALYQFYHTPAAGARLTLSGYSNPELDKLLEQGAVEKDEAKRIDIYKQAQHHIIDNAIIIPIYVFPYTIAAANSVQGLKLDALAYPRFNDTFIAK